jgi:excinuclease ABC subunit A
MSVDEALEFFAASPALRRILSTLHDVGLGYMSLGQSSTTLSGGEAQRIKLASELWRADSPSGVAQRSVLVLDEPSTGLAATDVEHLARCLGRLVRRGNAVVVIEHHTELLEVCDRLIELGPEGGEAGGQIIATGTPAELAANGDSITGRWLTADDRSTAKKKRGARKSTRGPKGAKAPGRAKKAPVGGGTAKSSGARKPAASKKRRQAR